MTRVYYREAVGALVVFDVTRASTFDAVLKWKDDLDSKVRQQLSELHSQPICGLRVIERLKLRLPLSLLSFLKLYLQLVGDTHTTTIDIKVTFNVRVKSVSWFNKIKFC